MFQFLYVSRVFPFGWFCLLGWLLGFFFWCCFVFSDILASLYEWSGLMQHSCWIQWRLLSELIITLVQLGWPVLLIPTYLSAVQELCLILLKDLFLFRFYLQTFHSSLIPCWFYKCCSVFLVMFSIVPSLIIQNTIWKLLTCFVVPQVPFPGHPACLLSIYYANMGYCGGFLFY